MRSRSPRSLENAEKSTSAIGIAITINGRMTVLIAKVQAPRPDKLTSFPISSDKTRSSINRAQRPPAICTANPLSCRNVAPENSKVGCQPARHQRAATKS